MSVSSRTNPIARLKTGGALALLVVVLAVFGVGSVAFAEPAAQAATPTATPAPTSATAASPTCLNTSGIQIVLENPQPGDTLLSGVAVNMSGIAFDAASNSGSGISSVTAYLGDRDAGGLSLGIALLGQPNPQVSAGSQFATAGWTLRTPSLPAGSGGRTIFVYARSAITNTERVLQVPVYLNTAPTPVKGLVPTAVVPAPPPCTPTPVPASPTPTPLPTVAALPAPPTLAPLPTLAPVPTLAQPAPAPAAPAAAAPAPAAPAAAAPAAAAPATAQTTAPRGGGIPSELGLALMTAGALALGSGVALRRRRRRPAAKEGDSVSGS